MPREPVVVTLGIFYISNLLYRRYAKVLFSFMFSVPPQSVGVEILGM